MNDNYVSFKSMSARMIMLVVICLISLGAASCSDTKEFKSIDMSHTKYIKTPNKHVQKEAIRIAVGGMITPREGFAYYKQLLNYIERKLGRKVEFIDREDYAEINGLLKDGKIDVAFVCGGPYVDGHSEFGMELLAAPVAYGKAEYYAYFIVNADSDIDSIEGLKNKVFAFTDPLSNSGKLVPTYMLAKMNETPESFFADHHFTYAHDKSIKAVAEGLVDGAAVDSLIWEYASRVNPEYTSRTKIIKKSAPYGIPPVVVRKGFNKKLMEELRQIFLTIHNDKTGREILKGMMVDRFINIDDTAYDSIRGMKHWMKKNEIEKPKTVL